MKKSAVWVLMTVLVFSLFLNPAGIGAQASDAASEKDDAAYIEGQLIVSVKSSDVSMKGIEGVNKKILGDVLREQGFAITDSIMGLGDPAEVNAFTNQEFSESVVKNMGLVYLAEYDVSVYASVEEAKRALAEALKENGMEIRHISKNYEMHAIGEPAGVSPQMHPNQQWHYNMINAPQAWGTTTGSSSVIQAVLDTGIDHNHQSLANLVNTSLGQSFVGGSTMDVQGHGTHVAGTIASYGSVSGVMHNATLVPVKVLNDSGSGSLFGITQGILYSADIGADVINMSLGGGGYNQSMAEAAQTAVNAGSIVIAASGNDGAGSISYPAAYSSVIAVGSVTSTGARSNFSNYGSGLELMAPGSNIYSTVPNNGYATFSGTSMASPHAAGVAGLMRAVNPNLSVSNARSIMQNTAQYAGSPTFYGYGIVDANAAVQQASGGSGGPSNITETSITTDRFYVQRGQNVTSTAQVTNETGQGLANATVTFTITRPNGSTLTNTATTNSSGVASWTVGTSGSTATGTYSVEASSSLQGYQGSSASTSFFVY
ncbi:S8 family serine peptidase [Alteribacter lacisalsi]|nr:S8 family serine peptidase [Alteribacter lacisalsi]